ncbi:vpu protein [Simian immunodeficiency virus]|uniref:Vpu protein n=1 Tax=Simian immunodeficiency virus TaxID=11723 RepID=J3SGI8_SIV|nr:vpu protein [Simian immunodeficiency virus]
MLWQFLQWLQYLGWGGAIVIWIIALLVIRKAYLYIKQVQEEDRIEQAIIDRYQRRGSTDSGIEEDENGLINWMDPDNYFLL